MACTCHVQLVICPAAGKKTFEEYCAQGEPSWINWAMQAPAHQAPQQTPQQAPAQQAPPEPQGCCRAVLVGSVRALRPQAKLFY